MNAFAEHLLVIVGHWLSGLHCMFLPNAGKGDMA
jgi:hypothetical protein